MEWLVLLLALIALFVFLLNEGRRSQQRGDAPSPKQTPNFRLCPLCNHLLGKGETIRATLFKNGSDRLMDIVGCPYCDPQSPLYDHSPRLCPVCKRQLEANETVPARIFSKPGKKMHIHVLGCKVCRRLNR